MYIEAVQGEYGNMNYALQNTRVLIFNMNLLVISVVFLCWQCNEMGRAES